MKEDCFLVDSGDLQKLEKIGKYLISRPCSTAVWKKDTSKNHLWEMADFIFSRKDKNRWIKKTKDSWILKIEDI